MRKEFNTSLVVIVCAILGIISAALANILYTQGIISSLFTGMMTIENFEFLIFFVWLIAGIIIGVLKD